MISLEVSSTVTIAQGVKLKSSFFSFSAIPIPSLAYIGMNRRPPDRSAFCSIIIHNLSGPSPVASSYLAVPFCASYLYFSLTITGEIPCLLVPFFRCCVLGVTSPAKYPQTIKHISCFHRCRGHSLTKCINARKLSLPATKCTTCISIHLLSP